MPAERGPGSSSTPASAQSIQGIIDAVATCCHWAQASLKPQNMNVTAPRSAGNAARRRLQNRNAPRRVLNDESQAVAPRLRQEHIEQEPRRHEAFEHG